MKNISNAKVASGAERTRLDWILYGCAIFSMLLIGVILLLSCARMYPELLGMGLLSFTLGLSHAFDIDHISAIDNMIRKLIQQQKNPRGVGFFFSLGHSTVVIIMALATIFAVKWAQTSISSFNTSGGVIVSAVSGCLLLALGLINLIMLKNTLKAFKGVRRGEQNPEKHQEPPQGLINRAINLLFNLVNNNWQVFAVGFLFGLGFDTATQIAVLATSASAASEAIPWLSVLSFPLLFTAGMTMMDTLDSVFMCTAYQWVFDSPLRKLYYNLTITGLSILAAGAVGIIEIAQVVSQEMGLSGGFWLWLQNLNFNITGYILVGIFVVVFIASYAGWKLLHLGEKEKLEASTLSVEGLGR